MYTEGTFWDELLRHLNVLKDFESDLSISIIFPENPFREEIFQHFLF